MQKTSVKNPEKSTSIFPPTQSKHRKITRTSTVPLFQLFPAP